MKHIIFDLDLTLIDSSIAENARKNRDWPLVYSLIPSFTLYEGMRDVFSFIRKNNIKVCIVSSAPAPYIQKVVRHFNIPSNYIVDYFAAKPIKPHPAPMIKALELLQEPSWNVVSFGDRSIDIQAANAANIQSIACYWGTKEESLLNMSSFSKAIKNPNEIINVLESSYQSYG